VPHAQKQWRNLIFEHVRYVKIIFAFDRTYGICQKQSDSLNLFLGGFGENRGKQVDQLHQLLEVEAMKDVLLKKW